MGLNKTPFPRFVVASIFALSFTTGAILRPAISDAQARPAGAGRVWTEIAAEMNVQSQQCSTCTRNGNAAGPALSAMVGATLQAGFGLALSGRTFQEFSTEHSQESKYLLVIGQYAPPSISVVSFNLGAGRSWHNGGPTDQHMNEGRSAVISGGVGLRLPPARRAAFTLSANIFKSVGGTAEFRPTTFAFGIGFGLSTACRNREC